MSMLKNMFLTVFLTVFVGSASAASVIIADKGDVTDSNMTVDRFVDRGLFDETTLFSISADQWVDGVASNWFIPNPVSGVLYDIELMSVKFAQNIGGVWNTLFDSPVASGGAAFFSGAITAGDYMINVVGRGIGEQGGRYALHGEFTSAVPEPSVIALMLGGLGLVGFMARRRKIV